MKRKPKSLRQCSICGENFPCFPSNATKTCGKPECHAEQWRRSRIGKPYKSSSPIGKGIDLTGRQFDDFEVIKPAGRRNRKVLWECRCKHCGNITHVASDQILNGGTQSCGCLRGKGLEVGRIKARKIVFQHGTHLGRIASETLQSNNTSGVRGVYLNKKTGRWRAFITFQGKYHGLRSHDTFEEAVEARKNAEEKLYGKLVREYSERKNKALPE